MAHHYSRKPNPGSGAMQSQVGNPQVYEDSDQKTSKKTKSPDQLVHEVHKEMGGDPAQDLFDLKDQRSNAKRLAAAEKRMHEQERVGKYNEPDDPRMPAWRNGHEPSKGAKLDAQIMQEERE
ncbi:hypothetical protein L211DRAFT_797638 [Terfezia boudieri ATCC MYA-4762]|uniref:Uncharacterized protein n=1 Tax=Terfezia boudieri ATCC MYA-4762 TaxID=1051890 RepID=A0A3N4L966_9PEZI|nr:hypothetical protein L211DRAFT_797638 [Terfezia boudieri ATCC MYA-4762]